MEQKKSSEILTLTAQEQLLRHNLETRDYWSQKELTPDDGVLSTSRKQTRIPASNWILTKNITLYPWQQDCVQAWLKNKQGTIKVVTGAGKTILALAIMEKMQTIDPNLRVAIVVPTIVLQNQWYDEIVDAGNLPPLMIGRLGGGHNDAFKKETKILLCVLNSAAKRLPTIVKKSQIQDHLLLIVDECHRAGAPDMSRVFHTDRAYNLGLSATPEREDQLSGSLALTASEYEQSTLGQELGPIIYELTVKQALEQGILPEFEIHHYGLSLTPKERTDYEQLTRRLRDLTAELREVGHQFGIHDSDITRKTQQLISREDRLGQIAMQHLSLTGQRKHLLYNAKGRLRAVFNILEEEFRKDKSTRALLFHEIIESVMLLYHQLIQSEFPVAVEHSELSPALRKESIELFRKGIAQVLVSAKALIEGFNVPETDTGIIVASSTSIRQRIQTIGRMLRKGKTKDKKAVIYVLYMQDTTDELIYGKTDWEDLLGARRNRYFALGEDGLIEEQEEPPRSPLPHERDLALENLTFGKEYPGAYEGLTYTVDSDGNVFTEQKELILNPQNIAGTVKKVKGSLGRFKITTLKRYILVLVPEADDWIVKFAGQLGEPFKKADLESTMVTAIEFDPTALKMGDVFPRELVDKDSQTIHLKPTRGRIVLARREGKKEQFARLGPKAVDPKKGQNAELLLTTCQKFRSIYPELTRLQITAQGHAVVLKDGVYLYLTSLPEGLEFP